MEPQAAVSGIELGRVDARQKLDIIEVYVNSSSGSRRRFLRVLCQRQQRRSE
jgi:hypothetical protein